MPLLAAKGCAMSQTIIHGKEIAKESNRRLMEKK